VVPFSREHVNSLFSKTYSLALETAKDFIWWAMVPYWVGDGALLGGRWYLNGWAMVRYWVGDGALLGGRWCLIGWVMVPYCVGDGALLLGRWCLIGWAMVPYWVGDGDFFFGVSDECVKQNTNG
jgi:hypothetical protein